MDPHRVVFIDETAVKNTHSRLRGRSQKGTRVEGTAPFGGWNTQTFIAGLSSSGLIAPWLISGGMDGKAFTTYISKVLAPTLEPGTAVVLDNFATHKIKPAKEALEAAGCWFLFLPPYSPDLNPIEMAFSKLKNHLRSIGARTFDGVFNAVKNGCELFSPDECKNYFRHAGYQ